MAAVLLSQSALDSSKVCASPRWARILYSFPSLLEKRLVLFNQIRNSRARQNR